MIRLFIVVLSLLFNQALGIAQNLSPEEQKMLLKEVQDLKDKLKITKQQTSGGLKKVNYKDQNIKQYPPSEESLNLSHEQMEELKKNINLIKMRQAESQKILDELDKEN